MEMATPWYLKTIQQKGDHKTMKKSIKTIAIMGIMLVSAYLLGATQAEIITEVQTGTEIREVVPNGYIPLNDDIVDMNTVVKFS